MDPGGEVPKIDPIHTAPHDIKVTRHMRHHLVDKPLNTLDIGKKRHADEKIVYRPFSA